MDPADRYETWAEYFDAALTERGWTPAEYARRHGGGLSPSIVSRWRNPEARLAPRSEVALHVADTLGADPSTVLRKAGYSILAARLAGAGSPPAASPHSVIEETTAMIRESGLPAPEQKALRETYQTELDGDLTLLQATIQRKIRNLLREIEAGERILAENDNDHTHNTA